MTNAEKYLKNENYKKTLWYDFKNWYNSIKCTCAYGVAFEMFMNEQIKITLTEDEKIILKNVNGKMKTISRDKDGYLMLHTELHVSDYDFFGYNHLFQFIKNGEEYEIEELLNND